MGVVLSLTRINFVIVQLKYFNVFDKNDTFVLMWDVNQKPHCKLQKSIKKKKKIVIRKISIFLQICSTFFQRAKDKNLIKMSHLKGEFLHLMFCNNVILSGYKNFIYKVRFVNKPTIKHIIHSWNCIFNILWSWYYFAKSGSKICLPHLSPFKPFSKLIFVSFSHFLFSFEMLLFLKWD